MTVSVEVQSPFQRKGNIAERGKRPLKQSETKWNDGPTERSVPKETITSQPPFEQDFDSNNRFPIINVDLKTQ